MTDKNNHQYEAVKRAEAYIAMFVLVAVTAALAEVAKLHDIKAVFEVLEHFWQSIAHFATDVTAAEIGVTAMLRAFAGD